MAQHAADHSRVARIAQAAAGGYSSSLLRDETAGMTPAVLRLAKEHDPYSGEAAQQRRIAELNDRLASRAQRKGATAQRELDCLTQAVYYEARGESPKGQFAVAQVVMNRVKHPAFPGTVCGVVFQGAGRRTGCQFSFACDGSMRRGREASAWTRARKVAARALAGAAIAEVGSATHFHTTAVAPAWGPQMRRVAQVGMHVFYKFGPRKPGAPGFQRAVLTSTPAEPVELRLTNVVVETPAAEPQAQTADMTASPPLAPEAKPEPASAKPSDAAALAAPQAGVASGS